MIPGASASPPSAAEPYAPGRRTALVLSGTGTAGVYHAGVLRALHEAGVKIDIAAGRGIGVIGALFAAIDGTQRLWDAKGFWRTAPVERFYAWDAVLRALVLAVAAAAIVTIVPLAAMAAALVVFPIDFVLTMTGLSAGGLVAWYLDLARAAFAPNGLPTWLPRVVVLILGAATMLAVGRAWTRAWRRRVSGPLWWRLVPAPLSAVAVGTHCWRAVWDLLRGAAPVRQPEPAELGRRYAEVLADGLGQPGFRELLIATHDLDTGRDLIFAMVAEARRRELFQRATSQEADARRAEVIDLAGVGRDYLGDALAASLAVPLATDPHLMTFAADGYWRGERHRLCDRPGSLARLLEELVGLGVEQVVLVSAAPESSGPHTLKAPRLDGRGRLGEYLQSSEAAVVGDLEVAWGAAGLRLFTIRPDHNPIGAFDFGGGFDERSDRARPLGELMTQGYEDAYRQFIEPVVGASGDRMG